MKTSEPASPAAQPVRGSRQCIMVAPGIELHAAAPLPYSDIAPDDADDLVRALAAMHGVGPAEFTYRPGIARREGLEHLLAPDRDDTVTYAIRTGDGDGYWCDVCEEDGEDLALEPREASADCLAERIRIVSEYRRDLHHGEPVKPIIVQLWDDQQARILDGFHRAAACYLEGRDAPIVIIDDAESAV